MGMLAATLGIIGGLCGIVGIITSFDILDDPIISKLGNGEFMFWFLVAGLLLLGSIAILVGYKERTEE